jgi:lipopolysaccharide assembly outer membrane protein LptD (OstA)
MSLSSKAYPLAALVVTAIAVGAPPTVPPAVAQSSQSALDALRNAARNRKTPLLLRIEAARREVSDQDMVVTFTGNVRATLGDTTVRTESLIAYYEQGTALGGARTTRPGPNGAQWIRKLEASICQI